MPKSKNNLLIMPKLQLGAIWDTFSEQHKNQRIKKGPYLYNTS